MKSIALILTILELALSPVDLAQAESPANSPANRKELARAISSRVNDPTALLSLIQFRNVLAPDVPGTDGAANLKLKTNSLIFHSRLTMLIGERIR